MTRPEHGTHEFNAPPWHACAACGARKVDVEDNVVSRACAAADDVEPMPGAWWPDLVEIHEGRATASHAFPGGACYGCTALLRDDPKTLDRLRRILWGAMEVQRIARSAGLDLTQAP